MCRSVWGVAFTPETPEYFSIIVPTPISVIGPLCQRKSVQEEEVSETKLSETGVFETSFPKNSFKTCRTIYERGTFLVFPPFESRTRIYHDRSDIQTSSRTRDTTSLTRNPAESIKYIIVLSRRFHRISTSFRNLRVSCEVNPFGERG